MRCSPSAWARRGSSPRPAPASTASRPPPPARCSGSSASSTWAPRTCAARRPTSSAWSCWARRSSPVDAGARTLKEAVSAAIRDWVANVGDTHYVIGSCVGPAPFPALVRDLQRIIGDEARAQILEKTGRLPDRVIACVGGGSNAIGIFVPVRRRRGRRARRRRGRGRGDRDRPPRRAADRRRPRRRAARRLLGDHAGRGRPDPRGALDLGRPRLSRAPAPSTPGCATPAARATSAITDAEALARLPARSPRLEGIIPALESAHARRLGPRTGARDAGETSTSSACRAAATRTSPRRSTSWASRERDGRRADRGRVRRRPRAARR